MVREQSFHQEREQGIIDFTYIGLLYIVAQKQKNRQWLSGFRVTQMQIMYKKEWKRKKQNAKIIDK